MVNSIRTEQRQHERYRERGKAIVQTTSTHAAGELDNISAGGVKVRQIDIRVSIEELVEVRFTPENFREEIRLLGRVKSVRPDFIGIEFLETGWWQSFRRKWAAFRTVSQKKLDGPLTPESLMEKIAGIQKKAAASPSLSDKTSALWEMEMLGVTFGRTFGKAAKPGISLDHPSLPAEARPIAHVGLGAGVVEAANFDRAEITRMIESLARVDHSLFAYESLGAMLGVYERTGPRKMLGLKPLNRPDPAQFIPSFLRDLPEVPRLISHGYGRLLFFNSANILKAVREVTAREFLEPRAAVQGVGFGYAMVNRDDPLDVILATSKNFPEPWQLQAFRKGLVYALEFWEWVSPGFLETLQPQYAIAREMIDMARREIAAARNRRSLPAFLVEGNPTS